jgi:hypothetical protein
MSLFSLVLLKSGRGPRGGGGVGPLTSGDPYCSRVLDGQWSPLSLLVICACVPLFSRSALECWGHNQGEKIHVGGQSKFTGVHMGTIPMKGKTPVLFLVADWISCLNPTTLSRNSTNGTSPWVYILR